MSTLPVIDPTTAGPHPAPTPAVPPPAVDPTIADPFFYGWRTVVRWQPNGSPTREDVPLTEWDVLHPQEEDHIMNNPAHRRTCAYVFGALEDTFAGRRDVAVFNDERIDWQVPGIIPHGPDVAVFDGLRSVWDPVRATFLVKEMHARPLLVIEVTSPSTRASDLNDKVVEYHWAGVPFYLIVDRPEASRRAGTELIGFRSTPEGFVRIAADPDRGVFIPSVRVWFRAEGDWVQCRTADGERFPERADLVAGLKVEKERAEQEKAKAAAEKERADDLARQLADLQLELNRRPPGA